MKISNFSALSLFLGILFVFSFPFSALADSSEMERARKHISQIGYDFPDHILEKYDQIENELTPLRLRLPQSPEQIVPQNGCGEFIYQVLYLDEKQGISSFGVSIYSPPMSEVRKHPAVLIQPTLAGPSVLDRTMAMQFCRRGIVAALPSETVLDFPEKKDLPDFGIYDRNTGAEVRKARRIVDLLETFSYVDSEKLGVIGFSRGAIVGGLLIGIEPRLKVAYLGGGGLGAAEIIGTSQTEKGIEENGMQMEAAKITNESEYVETLRQNIFYDGLLFAHRVEGKKIKLMIVSEDQLVAHKNQRIMQKAFFNPEIVLMNDTKAPQFLNKTIFGSGHVGSIVSNVFLYPNMYQRFFKKAFDELDSN